MTTNLNQEIKELEEKLGSLRAEQRLLEAQEKLQKEKAGSLFEDESLTSLIQTVQNELTDSDLGLALSFNYKKNWVFLVRDENHKNGLASFNLLTIKDGRVVYGLVETSNQVVTVESIQTWLENTLKVLDFLNKTKRLVESDKFFKIKFKSYDNALSKLYFTLTDSNFRDYECILTVNKPYRLTMSQLLSYDAEFSTIHFLWGGVSLQTKANYFYINDDNHLGTFEQKLTVHQLFTEFSDFSEVAKELTDKLATFYEALEPRFE